MKIIFMGTPDFAAEILQGLVEAGHEIALVVTKPDKPAGRGGKLVYSEVKTYALKKGLEVYQPVRIRDAEAQEKLCSVGADIGVVAAFGQILSEENLRAPRLGCINVHASLLPKYRGSSPIQQAILDGEKTTGVTIMQMDAGVDTGDILLQRTCAMAEGETAGTLFDKLSDLGTVLAVKALEMLEAGEITPVKQEGEASYTKQITKDMGDINWNQDAAYIARVIRAMNPWPSAYTRLPDRRIIKIWGAFAEQSTAKRSFGTPGVICDITKDAFYVACGGGSVLRITEVQVEGKKRMSARDFMLGFSLEPGVTFN